MVTRELGTAVKVLTGMLPGMIVELRRGKATEGSELCGLFCGSSETSKRRAKKAWLLPFRRKQKLSGHLFNFE